MALEKGTALRAVSPPSMCHYRLISGTSHSASEEVLSCFRTASDSEIGETGTPLHFPVLGWQVRTVNAGRREKEMNLIKLKQVVVVEGVSNSGKTTLLLDVCSKLKRAYSATPPIVDMHVNSKGDRHLVMNAKAGRLTAVCTPGDDANWIVKSFALAEKYGCEVLVCAKNVPARPCTTPMARIAFDEIVANNQLSPVTFTTTKIVPKLAAGYVDNMIVTGIMNSI